MFVWLALALLQGLIHKQPREVKRIGFSIVCNKIRDKNEPVKENLFTVLCEI